MLGASRVGGALIYVSAPCGLSYQYVSASTTVRLIRFIHMPRDTGLRCGCCRCEHAGKETVSRSTYNRHKQYRTDQLSSPFQLFVANNSAARPHQTSRSHPPPFLSHQTMQHLGFKIQLKMKRRQTTKTTLRVSMTIS